LAALAKIASCSTICAWWRADASMFLLMPGDASLALFGWLLTQLEADFADRAFAS
jgi:small multidrug resistance family-3 protein